MKLRTILTITAISYLIFTLYALFVLMYRSERRLERTTRKGDKNIAHLKLSKAKDRKAMLIDMPRNAVKPPYSVEIWGKAAIGLYLWEHIFDAALDSINGEFLKCGKLEVENVVFQFRTGPMFKPGSIDKNVKNAVLVINGREESKTKFALNWLENIERLDNLENFAVVLLGNEECRNDWLMPYMKSNGGFVKFAFIVYDVPYIDDGDFHPWPLGVATYRNFPLVRSSSLALEHKRKYICNFLGTIYKNSSREELLKIINADQSLKESCFVHVREEWLPAETKETSESYRNALKDSDITLNPVGKNTECYRIYEAVSFGSVPIIEDLITPGKCGKSVTEDSSMVPLRLLKRMNAPFIYIKSWKELPDIIAKEKMLTIEHKVERRKKLVHWYEKFKYDLRKIFVKQLKSEFHLR